MDLSSKILNPYPKMIGEAIPYTGNASFFKMKISFHMNQNIYPEDAPKKINFVHRGNYNKSQSQLLDPISS